MIKNFLILLLSVTFFVGCSSDSDEPEISNASSAPAHKTGAFYITQPVANLHYTTATFDEYTNEDGQFKYREGETITFSVAGVDLGSAEARVFMTPLNLVPGSAEAEDSSAVNIVALLLSLDSGGLGGVLTIDNAVSTYEFVSDFDISNPLDSLALLTELSTNTDGEYTAVDSSYVDTLLSLLSGDS